MESNKKQKQKDETIKLFFEKNNCVRVLYKERTPAETRQVIICFSWHDSGCKRSRYRWGPLVSMCVIYKPTLLPL